jgi:hypothetical protein
VAAPARRREELVEGLEGNGVEVPSRSYEALGLQVRLQFLLLVLCLARSRLALRRPPGRFSGTPVRFVGLRVPRGAGVSGSHLSFWGKEKQTRLCCGDATYLRNTGERASQVPRAPDFRVAAQLLQSRREHRSGPAVVAVLGRTAVSGGCRPRTANAAATSRVFALRCLLATLLEGGAALRQRREPTRGHGCALR